MSSPFDPDDMITRKMKTMKEIVSRRENWLDLFIEKQNTPIEPKLSWWSQPRNRALVVEFIGGILLALVLLASVILVFVF